MYPVFTVFTPTYNRAHTLHRVYNSLCQQTFRSFEWLVVDDGSVDDTRQLIIGWQQSAPFSIRYLYQPNQGKHIAFNLGVENAQGKFLAAVDSDDALTPDALEILYQHWQEIPEQKKPQFTGVVGLCVTETGTLVSKKFPYDVMDSDSLEMHYRYKVTGEKFGMSRVDILRQYPFPVIAGTRFVVEGVVWSQIAMRYKARFINRTLRIYYQDEGDDSDRITRRPAQTICIGMAFWHQSVLNNELNWFFWSPIAFLKSAVHFVRFSLHAQKGIASQTNALKSMRQKLLWLAALPIGCAVYYRDCRRT